MLKGIWRNRLRRHSPRNAVAPHGDGVISVEERESKPAGEIPGKMCFSSAHFFLFWMCLAPITYGSISRQQNIKFFVSKTKPGFTAGRTSAAGG